VLAEIGTAFADFYNLAGPEHYPERAAAWFVWFLRGSVAGRPP
jgi:hypothetical protein